MKDDVEDSQNKTFAQQRRVLRALLDEGEQKVPSTTASIMAAIWQEQRTQQEASVKKNNEPGEVVPIVPFPQKQEIETPRPRRTRRFLYSTLALIAVAVVLIASFGLFSSLSVYRSASTNSAGSAAMSSNAANYPSFIPSATATWSEVIITYRINNTTVIANYNPLSGNYATLATSPYADTSVDGVSHKGQMVLYSVYDGLKTMYYLYPQSTTDPFYTTPNKSGSAVWSTDDRTVFISTAKGVAQIDVQSHSVKLILPALAATKLLNYRSDDGYLYFIKGYKGQAYAAEGTLNRVNVAHRDMQQITPCERGANFWLSPGGVTVYYTCPDQDATLLYAVHSDGTTPHVFSANIHNVIGYVDNGSPLALVHVNGKYQVVLQDLNTAQDTVVVGDVAPGATMVTAGDVAVAPGGHMLVAKGAYSGSATAKEQLWYGNVVAGTNHLLQLPQGADTLSVIGWDKLQVQEDMLTSTP